MIGRKKEKEQKQGGRRSLHQVKVLLGSLTLPPYSREGSHEEAVEVGGKRRDADLTVQGLKRGRKEASTVNLNWVLVGKL